MIEDPNPNHYRDKLYQLANDFFDEHYPFTYYGSYFTLNRTQKESVVCKEIVVYYQQQFLKL